MLFQSLHYIFVYWSLIVFIWGRFSTIHSHAHDSQVSTVCTFLVLINPLPIFQWKSKKSAVYNILWFTILALDQASKKLSCHVLLCCHYEHCHGNTCRILEDTLIYLLDIIQEKYIKFRGTGKAHNSGANKTKDGWWAWKWADDFQVNPHVAADMPSERNWSKGFSTVLNRTTHNKATLIRSGLSHTCCLICLMSIDK